MARYRMLTTSIILLVVWAITPTAGTINQPLYDDLAESEEYYEDDNNAIHGNGAKKESDLQSNASDTNYNINDVYNEVMGQIKAQMNFGADPCTDFYEYACGRTQRGNLELSEMTNAHALSLVNVIENLGTKFAKPSMRMKAVRYYWKCRNALARQRDQSKHEDAIETLMDDFAGHTGFQFLSSTPNSTATLRPKPFSNALGVLSKLGIHTFVTPTNNPNHPISLVEINASTLMKDLPYYANLEYDTNRVNEYKGAITRTVEAYFHLLNEAIPVSFRRQLSQFVKLEERIAQLYSYGLQTVDRSDRSNEQLFTSNDTVAFLDIDAYLNGLSCGFNGNCSSPSGSVLVRAPRLLDDLFAILDDFEPQVIMDYLFCRILLKINYRQETEFVCVRDSKSHQRELKRLIRTIEIGDKLECYEELQSGFKPFLEQLESAMINETEVKNLNSSAQEIMATIRHSMINTLSKPFISANRSPAELMLTRMLASVPLVIYFPEGRNESELDMFYRGLNFDRSDSFCLMREKLRRFREANGTPGMHSDPPVDGFSYNRATRMIHLPWFLLAKPVFSSNWPTLANYGFLGATLAHELTHAFQCAGWRASGNRGFSRQLEAKYDRMEACIVQQYSQYCPLKNADAEPMCVSGTSTADENIADNIGILAAYSAYKNASNKAAEALPPTDRQFEKLGQDKLFFLSYAQSFCHRPFTYNHQSEMLSDDEHSPAKYRVLATFANIPAFHQAFNCKARSREQQLKRCDIWQ